MNPGATTVTALEDLIAQYPDACEKRDAARRAAEEGRKNAGLYDDPQEVWLLELRHLEAAQALLELSAEINHADPALERLRALLIEELKKAALDFVQTYGADLPATPRPLSDPTPGAVSAKVDAMLASETIVRARKAQREMGSPRLKLVFQVVSEALQLIAAERRARGLPSPSKPNRFVDFDLNGSLPTNPRECATLIQRIEAMRQPLAGSGTPGEIGELRARIRNHQAEQQQKAKAEEREARERLARKADEERANQKRHAESVAKYKAQDQEAALAALKAPLTPEEVARAAGGGGPVAPA